MLKKLLALLMTFFVFSTIANAQAVPGFQIRQGSVVYANPVIPVVVQKQYLVTPYRSYGFYQSYDPFLGYNYRYYIYQRPLHYNYYGFNRGYWWR